MEICVVRRILQEQSHFEMMTTVNLALIQRKRTNLTVEAAYFSRSQVEV